MIEQYSFGSITILGRQYTTDLKIIHGKVYADWWRTSGHSVALDDIADIISAQPDYLVIGSGSSGLMKVSGPLVKHLVASGIQLVEEPTSRAIQTFNQMYAAGKNVAGGFHLTC